MYGVAAVSRIDQIIDIFCRISSLLQGSFAKEPYNLIDPTDRSHPIVSLAYNIPCTSSVSLYHTHVLSLVREMCATRYLMYFTSFF